MSTVRIVPALVAAVALAGLSACSAEARLSTTPKVEPDKLAAVVKDKLTEKFGQAPDDVTCEKALPGKVDATTRCMLTAGGDKVGITVTTTSVEDDNINFDIKVDDAVQ